MFLLGSPLSGSVGVVSGERERVRGENHVVAFVLFCRTQAARFKAG